MSNAYQCRSCESVYRTLDNGVARLISTVRKNTKNRFNDYFFSGFTCTRFFFFFFVKNRAITHIWYDGPGRNVLEFLREQIWRIFVENFVWTACARSPEWLGSEGPPLKRVRGEGGYSARSRFLTIPAWYESIMVICCLNLICLEEFALQTGCASFIK